MQIFLWQTLKVTFPESFFPFSLLRESQLRAEMCFVKNMLLLTLPWPSSAMRTTSPGGDHCGRLVGQPWERVLFCFSDRGCLRRMGLCPLANSPLLLQGGDSALLRLRTNATHWVAVSRKLDRTSILRNYQSSWPALSCQTLHFVKREKCTSCLFKQH